MALPTQAVSLIRVPDILATLTSPAQRAGTELELFTWEVRGRPARRPRRCDLMTTVDAGSGPAQIGAEVSVSVLSRPVFTIARMEGDLDVTRRLRAGGSQAVLSHRRDNRPGGAA